MKKTRIVIHIRHESGWLNWDDVIQHAQKCKAQGVPVPVRRNKSKRERRAREIAKLIRSQKQDERDRLIRFEKAIG